jgi:AAA+ ATPase superfamily predicted ATPase
MEFVDREMELGLLTDLSQRQGAQLLVLYGRRRIGKTRLLTHWLSGRGEHHFYWVATQTSTVNQLRSFSQAIYSFLNPGSRIDPTFSYASWEAAFDEIQRATLQERLVVILDEFTYITQANPEVSSILQHAWDQQLKEHSNVFLILTGSLAGMIQRHVLDYQAPLYGRATGRIRLQALPFGALVDILPRYRSDERVAVYAIAGGVPAYLELFDDRLSITENLRQRIVTPANIMMEDAVFLLHEQLDAPRNYMAIIEAIAAGHHTLTDLARMAGISRTHISKYLGVLQELGYVERQVPATVRRPEKSRKGRYVIVDPYMRFYFRFLHPNLSFIERGMQKQAISLMQDHLVDFIGTHTFEELCQDWVTVQADLGNLPFLPERVGAFWSPDVQVDIVAASWRTKNILLGECKWLTGKVSRGVIRQLVDKSERMLPRGDWTVHYVFFARQGFTQAARQEAQSLNAAMVTLEQLERDLYQWMKSRPSNSRS